MFQHLKKGRLERPPVPLPIEQRRPTSRQPRLERREPFTIPGEIQGDADIGLGVPGDELGQAGADRERGRDPAREGGPEQRHDRQACPEGVGRRGMRAVGGGVEKQVGAALARQMRLQRGARREDKARRIDAGRLRSGPQATRRRRVILHQPQHGAVERAQQPHPVREGLRPDLQIAVEAGEDKAFVGQPDFGPRLNWPERRAGVRRLIDVRQANQPLLKFGLRVRRRDDGIHDHVIDPVRPERSGETEKIDLHGRRPRGQNARPGARRMAHEIDGDVDPRRRDGLRRREIGKVANVDEPVECALHASPHGAGVVGTVGDSDDFEPFAIMRLDQMRDQMRRGMGAIICRDIGQTDLASGRGLGRRPARLGLIAIAGAGELRRPQQQIRLVEVAQDDEGIGRVRILAYATPSLRDQLRTAGPVADPALAVQKLREGLAVSRRQRQRPFLAGDGFAKALELGEQHAAMAPGLDEVRLEGDGPVIGEKRVLRTSQASQRVGLIAPAFSEIRLQRHRSLETGERRGRAAEVHQDAAAIVLRAGEIRTHVERAFQRRESRRAPARRRETGADRSQGLGMRHEVGGGPARRCAKREADAFVRIRSQQISGRPGERGRQTGDSLRRFLHRVQDGFLADSLASRAEPQTRAARRIAQRLVTTHACPFEKEPHGLMNLLFRVASTRWQGSVDMQPRLSLRESTLFLTIPDDAFIGKSLEVYGEWSFGEVEFLGQALSAGDNIVEAGANIGAHTVFLARDICKAGVVYAFEPRRLLHQMLCANLSVNGVSNVHTFQTALGRESGVLTEGPMPLSGVVNSGGFSLGEIEGEEETIPIEPLDRFLPQMKRIAAIKADVEGHELEVIEGARGLIARDRPLLYLENDRPAQSEALLSALMGLDYDIWWHIVPLFRANNKARVKENIFGEIGSFNIFASPKERNVKVANTTKIEDPRDHPLRR